MYELLKLLHLSAAVLWLGGMAFVLWALRPVLVAQLAPAQRLPLLAAVLARFFLVVSGCVALLLATGAAMLAGVDPRLAPVGWHVMTILGLVMAAVFGWLYAIPFRHLRRAVVLEDWPAAGRHAGRMHRFVVFNFVLGWLAVTAVLLWR